jgi:hypothetical protein
MVAEIISTFESSIILAGLAAWQDVHIGHRLYADVPVSPRLG